MKAIGLGHRIRELAGWHLITMESGSLTVTGTEIAVGLNITTAGTGTETGILIETGTEIGTGTTVSNAIFGCPTPPQYSSASEEFRGLEC